MVTKLAPSVVQVTATLLDGQSAATGIVYDDEGHLLTAWHVIDSAISITVRKSDGTVVPAREFRSDPAADLALLVVDDTEGLIPAVFADLSDVEVGQDALAIGFALGLEGSPTVSRGIVSALGRSLPSPSGDLLEGLIQTDAAISSGSSGGPLVNEHGEVIGINTVKLNLGQGIGFAINVEVATAAAESFLELGESNPGFIGIATENVSADYVSSLGLPAAPGVLIDVVGTATPAEAAGLMIGDIILSIDGESITNRAELAIFLNEHPPETDISVFLWRLDLQSQWQPLQVDVTLGDLTGGV